MQPAFFYNFYILDINENMVENQEFGECFIPLDLHNEFYGRETKEKDHSGSQDLATASLHLVFTKSPLVLCRTVHTNPAVVLSFSIRLTHRYFKHLSRCTKHVCTNFVELLRAKSKFLLRKPRVLATFSEISDMCFSKNVFLMKAIRASA